ncbi:MAG: nucleotide sugar dehydrogenase [Candidatus Rokubacteria bacterium]|nr:nucleotide sugar dehydrogenase [Candidatus Rokubacteria bacterium]
MRVMSEIARELRLRFEQRSATVGIVGLGYVGLPLVIAFGKAGFRVLGVDADPARVTRLQSGDSPIEDVSSSTLVELLRSGRFTVNSHAELLTQADAILICVPTPLGKSKEPDISYIVAAADAVARILHPGQLVILESTTYPGTTEEVLLPRFQARGLTVGREFFLAFSPERIDPGNKHYDLSRIPKVVGAVTPTCVELARILYSQIIEQVVLVSSPQVAEMVKLFENVFRSVNIALVNELALLCRRLGLSVWEVIEAAATKPFGYMPFYPGPGIGGHCIPTDPYYLSWRARLAGHEPRFITFADEINQQMPGYVVQLAADALNDRGKHVRGATILVLGVAYKPGVGDTRESPAVEIMELLRAKGAKVAYVDPHVPEFTLGQECLTSLSWETVDLTAWDLVLILTNHPEFDPKRVVREATLVLDTRNATGGEPGPLPHVIRL